MITPSSQDTSTQAKIVILEPGASPGNNAAQHTFIDTIGFTYSSDPTIVGDPFTVAVPNPNGAYTNQLHVGSKVQLFLQNPRVGAGALTHKQTGLIIRRRATSSSQGTTIFLECADLGWHLLNNDAPLFAPLSGGTKIEELLKKPEWIHPKWGISYVPKYDNKTNRNMKLNNGRAGKELNLNLTVEKRLQRIQVEPGDKIADLLVKYAKRKNSFVNVNVDGHIQFWNPDENQTSKYVIEYHPAGTPESVRNNVLEATLEEDLSNQWTEVTCVGEKIITQAMETDPSDINGSKVQGTFPDLANQPNPPLLPFPHHLVFSDGEISEDEDAWRLAKWRYQRGRYDSWKVTYVVKNHYQGDRWWEADTLCDVNDTVNGIVGTYYLCPTTYIRDEQGDRTQLVIRKMELLQAYLNPKDVPPKIKKRKTPRQRKKTQPPKS